MKRIGLLGFGEIGQAIHKVYTTSSIDVEILIKDLNRDDGLNEIDVLNVAIPYNDKFDFVEEVVRLAKSSSAKMVIIHSTVAIGTTQTIKKKLKDVIIAHSPCRGIHPNLYEGIKTFVKFVGSPSHDDSLLIERHLNEIGITTHVCKNSETTELAKLLDTAYYGICIAYHGEAQKACEQFNADFNDVMTTYNQTYNIGYSSLGKSNVIRPILTAPVDGIGGHCVVQNADLLKNQFKSIALDLILEYKKVK